MLALSPILSRLIRIPILGFVLTSFFIFTCPIQGESESRNESPVHGSNLPLSGKYRNIYIRESLIAEFLRASGRGEEETDVIRNKGDAIHTWMNRDKVVLAAIEDFEKNGYDKGSSTRYRIVIPDEFFERILEDKEKIKKRLEQEAYELDQYESYIHALLTLPFKTSLECLEFIERKNNKFDKRILRVVIEIDDETTLCVIERLFEYAKDSLNHRRDVAFAWVLEFMPSDLMKTRYKAEIFNGGSEYIKSIINEEQKEWILAFAEKEKAKTENKNEWVIEVIEFLFEVPDAKKDDITTSSLHKLKVRSKDILNLLKRFQAQEDVQMLSKAFDELVALESYIRPDEDEWLFVRKYLADLWIRTGRMIEAKSDREFDPDKFPQRNVSSPEPYPSGISSESIEKPELWEQYKQAIKANETSRTKYEFQLKLEAMKIEIFKKVEETLIALYMKPPEKIGELARLLESYGVEKLFKTAMNTIRIHWRYK